MSWNSTKLEEPLEWDGKEVASIILVCIVFLGLSYYSIMKRICCSVSHSTNQAQRRLLDESIRDDRSLEFQSHGLEFSVIHSLPISKFKKSEGEEKPSNADCAICLGEFDEGESLKHLPNCTHVFHVSCIESWFQSHSNCPLCRSHVHLDLTAHLECSISSHTLLEALRREEFSQERAAHYQSMPSQNLQSSATR